jgi:hypothetical protein
VLLEEIIKMMRVHGLSAIFSDPLIEALLFFRFDQPWRNAWRFLKLDNEMKMYTNEEEEKLSGYLFLCFLNHLARAPLESILKEISLSADEGIRGSWGLYCEILGNRAIPEQNTKTSTSFSKKHMLRLHSLGKGRNREG